MGLGHMRIRAWDRSQPHAQAGSSLPRDFCHSVPDAGVLSFEERTSRFRHGKPDHGPDQVAANGDCARGAAAPDHRLRGSGKTEVVSRRIAQLLLSQAATGLTPRHVVAFTFTEKAAAELEDRVIARSREVGGSVTGLAELFVGTIHGYCLNLLLSEVPHYSKFDVLNEVQQTLFLDRHSRASGLTVSTDRQGQPLRRFVDTPHYLNALNLLRECEIRPEHLATCSVRVGLDLYRSLLDRHRFLDFSALLEPTAHLLTKDQSLRRAWPGGCGT